FRDGRLTSLSEFVRNVFFCVELQISYTSPGKLSPMKVPPQLLRELVSSIFHKAGCHPPEAERIAAHLVEANLVGHDSHGVIRVSSYVQWLKTGKVLADRTIQVVYENEAIAVVDGQFGFGQSI